MTLHCLAATKIQIVTKVQTKKQVPNHKRVASDTHNDQNGTLYVNSFMAIPHILLQGQVSLP